MACWQTRRAQRGRRQHARCTLPRWGVDGAGPREHTPGGQRGRGTDPGAGAACGASAGPAVSPRRWSAVPPGWLQRVQARTLGPWWRVGAPRTSPRHRPAAQAALAAAAPVPLCAGGHIFPAPPQRGRQAPGGLRHDGAGHAGAGGVWLAAQSGVGRQVEPRDSSARGGSGPARQHLVSGPGRCAPAADVMPSVPELCPAARQPPPALAPTSPAHGHGLGQAVAALSPGDGGGVARPGGEPASRPTLSGAAVATATERGSGWRGRAARGRAGPRAPADRGRGRHQASGSLICKAKAGWFTRCDQLWTRPSALPAAHRYTTRNVVCTLFVWGEGGGGNGDVGMGGTPPIA
jgi:hypothetical protein